MELLEEEKTLQFTVHTALKVEVKFGAGFNNSHSLHFLLAAWPIVGIWFTALGINIHHDRSFGSWSYIFSLEITINSKL